MYALVACFDTRTETTVRELWDELSLRGISQYAFEVENRTPHVTLASYETLSVEAFIQQMDEWYPMQSRFELTFQSIGSFLNTNILYLTPLVDDRLLHFHRRHHDVFQTFHDSDSSMYVPSRWVPHCTLANRLSETKYVEAVTYMMRYGKTIQGFITRVELIRLTSPNRVDVVHAVDLKWT